MPATSTERRLPQAGAGPVAVPGRRRGLVLALALAPLTPLHAAPGRTPVEIWKSPDCGCCKDWMVHMEDRGFSFRVHDTGNTGARTRLGLPKAFGSCHTALVDGYVLEGHVPARDVLRLLRERPAALGLAVPGMPVGSPGMDGPAYQGRRDPYDVLLVRRDGSSAVYQSYR